MFLKENQIMKGLNDKYIPQMYGLRLDWDKSNVQECTLCRTKKRYVTYYLFSSQERFILMVVNLGY